MGKQIIASVVVWAMLWVAGCSKKIEEIGCTQIQAVDPIAEKKAAQEDENRKAEEKLKEIERARVAKIAELKTALAIIKGEAPVPNYRSEEKEATWVSEVKRSGDDKNREICRAYLRLDFADEIKRALDNPKDAVTDEIRAEAGVVPEDMILVKRTYAETAQALLSVVGSPRKFKCSRGEGSLSFDDPMRVADMFFKTMEDGGLEPQDLKLTSKVIRDRIMAGARYAVKNDLGPRLLKDSGDARGALESIMEKYEFSVIDLQLSKEQVAALGTGK